MPVVALFRVEDRLTIGFVRRRSHKLNPKRAVLEQVTLIKDIALNNPHRAHLDILFELSLEECAKWMVTNNQPENFDGLLAAWLARLDTEELNKRFFSEIANWYFWAVKQVRFPDDASEDVEVRNATSVIRLLTRLIFVWFVKEKGLVPDALFNQPELGDILKNIDPQESTYYKAILQNLFFATLNQEMNTEKHPNNRKFRGKAKQSKGRDQNYMVHSLYRYERYFKHPKVALNLFETIPFLNGGLFECLDKPGEDESEKDIRIDGFSDRKDISLHVPNELFFSDEQTVDLNKAYGTKGKKYKVQGLIDTLDRYKFTVTENTPIEEEVALDPELLGKVFENLLAAYNPETGATARKQTGSYYTPREIVNYMTDESLVAYLKNELRAHAQPQGDISVHTPPSQLDFTGQAEPVQTELDMGSESRSDDEQKSELEKKLRNLLAYNDEPNPFNQADTETLIKAIDSLKILDPACGSGAFPMGVLHKLVFILGKLDPRNDRWRQRQIDRVESTVEMAEKIDDSTVRDNTIRDLEGEIVSINEAFERNELDYGRKLYLIENCIYGVDIQPIAVQIAKLRFFISLIVDQQLDDSQANRGVRPLPNLETKFVAANTLLDVEKPEQLTFRNPEIDRKEKELENVRRKHFTALTPSTKAKYRHLDTQIRTQIGELLKAEGFPHETTEKIVLWDLYDQNATADWFDHEWMFGITDGFDVVIGNPPYGLLNKRQNKTMGHLASPEEIQYYRTSSEYAPAMGGMINVFRLFIVKSVHLLNDNGVFSQIFPLAFIGDVSSSNLRKYLLENYNIVSIDAFPERDNAKKRVFEGVKMSVCILNLLNQKSTGKFFIRIHRDRFVDIENEKVILDTENISLIDKANYAIPLLRERDLNLIRKIYSESSVRIVDLGHCYTGEIDLTANKKYLTDDPECAVMIKGAIIDKYLIREKMSQGEVKFLNSKHYLRENQGVKSQHHKSDRIVMQAITGVNERIRLKMTLIEKGVFCANSVNYLVFRNNAVNTKYILALLNSSTLNFVFSKSSTNSNVNGYEIDNLPIVLADDQHQTRLSELVDQILTAKRTNPNANVSNLENKIDKIVYLLYDLTLDEIKIVEEASE